ncbi:MAG: RdgB/HAM1 family non-canonical purine NTP pyrophosphatase [gamma proteobacterium symbiont of Bathyaustriella thionipta]|nr:RdgB/HAM1 family non-canonical purine NTP pyrophosphatase [gamma proteobacterium symbiont of Bathyaustriella thionipta]
MPSPTENILVLASNNAGKVREINELLQDSGIQVAPQKDFSVSSAIEDGLSFVENAIIKARHAARISGLPSIADDSGIEIDALGGKPGIYSARFAGENASDDDNVKKVLHDLQAFNDDQRGARFQCVLVYMRHAEDPTPLIFHGTWEGAILRQPQGENGFGYDPVFYVTDADCSAAQLSADEKNKRSHRGQALRSFSDWWHRHQSGKSA